MKQYELFAKNALNAGTESSDRTGTGTVRVVGGELRYNLKDGFPIVTTKKVSLSFILKELAWFLEGSTSQKVLKEVYGCSIWDEWADEFGRLGPVYGAMWVRRPATNIEIVRVPVFKGKGLIISRAEAEKIIAGAVRKYGGDKKAYVNPVFKVWTLMINAVAATSERKVANNVPDEIQRRSLCKTWLDFKNFERDFYSLPGNELTAKGDSSTWIFHTNNNGRGIFSKQTLQFIESYKEALVRVALTRTILELHDNGIYNEVFAPRFYINQLADAIEQIKTNPNSRRIIVDSWEPSLAPKEGVAPNKQAAIGRQALAPCHYCFQFLVMPAKKKGDKPSLNMVFSMRSTDVALGLPYNISSYAVLLHLVALECDLDVGELVYQGADVHVYKNHVKTLRTQLRRKTHELPKLVIDPSVKKLSDFKPELVSLSGHIHGPVTSYQVAV